MFAFAFNDLTDDVHFEIFKYLEFKQRVTHSLVNKKWADVFGHLWKSQKALVITTNKKSYRMVRKLLIGCHCRTHQFSDADVVEVPKLRYGMGMFKVERLVVKCVNLVALYLDIDKKVELNSPFSKLCPNVKHIAISGNEAGLKLLLECEHPQNLTCLDFHSLWDLSPWHTLNSSAFEKYALKSEVIQFIAKCTNLITVVWGDDVPKSILNSLNVETLQRISTQVGCEKCNNLEQFKNLQTLDVIDLSSFSMSVEPTSFEQLIVSSHSAKLISKCSYDLFLARFGSKIKAWKSNLALGGNNFTEFDRFTLLGQFAVNLTQLEVTFFEPHGKLVLLESAWQSIYSLKTLKKLKLEGVHANDTNLQVLLNNLKKLRVLYIRDYKSSSLEVMRSHLMDFVLKHPRRAITFKLGSRLFTGQTRVEVVCSKE